MWCKSFLMISYIIEKWILLRLFCEAKQIVIAVVSIALIFLIIVISIFCYIFFAPFYLELDSTRNLCRLRFHYLARVSFQMVDDLPFIQLQIFGWKKQLNILNIWRSGPKKQSKQSVATQKSKKRKAKSSTIPWKKIKNVLASFRINHCQISLDFGDVRANALLYPIVYWIKVKSKKNIAVNFIGENKIILEIENSLARMSWAYISSS